MLTKHFIKTGALALGLVALTFTTATADVTLNQPPSGQLTMVEDEFQINFTVTGNLNAQSFEISYNANYPNGSWQTMDTIVPQGAITNGQAFSSALLLIPNTQDTLFAARNATDFRIRVVQTTGGTNRSAITNRLTLVTPIARTEYIGVGCSHSFVRVPGWEPLIDPLANQGRGATAAWRVNQMVFNHPVPTNPYAFVFVGAELETPISLSFIGLPQHCNLYLDPATMSLYSFQYAWNGGLLVQMQMPTDERLIGTRFAIQALTHDSNTIGTFPGSGGHGSTAGLRIILGERTQ